MSISICPAPGWWAVFDKNDTEIKVPVVFFEIETLEVGIGRRAIVIHPNGQLLDAFDHPAFLRLEVSADPSRKVSKQSLLDFLKQSGAGYAEDDLKARIKDGLVDRAVEIYVDEQFDAFVEKEGL